MNKLHTICLAFWLTLASVFSATGDVGSVTIAADGWYSDVAIAGLSTGGNYASAMGLGTNNEPETGTPKITFSVTSLGYDNTGAAITVPRTVYGTSSIRVPYLCVSIPGTWDSGTFQTGETVTQATTGATGTILFPYGSGVTDFNVVLGPSSVVPNNSAQWTGATSNAKFTSGGAATFKNAIGGMYFTQSCTGNSGTFQLNETVTQATSGATATCKFAGAASGTITFAFVLSAGSAQANAANQWTGGTSGAKCTPVSGATQPESQSTYWAQEWSNGTNFYTRIALSDYIYQKDNTGGGNSGTAPTVNILASFYTGGSANNATGAGFAVTNNSTAAYPKVVGNWSRPGFNRITGNFTLGCCVFHGTSVTNGWVQTSAGQMNIACVKFTAADTSAHTATTIVTAPGIDTSYGDPMPVIEHYGTMDVSTLTALNTLTCNFIAYPLVGDSGAILDTSAGTAQPTPLYGPITQINDKSNTYGVTVALVDPTGSDAGANTVYDAGSFNPATAYKFLTIGKAASQIAVYNNANRSRNNVAGGIIYCNAGTYGVMGSSNSYGETTPAISNWLIVTRSPGTAIADVIFDSQSGNFIRTYHRMKFYEVNLSGVGTNVFGQGDALWADKCLINYTGDWLAGGTVSYFTRNTVTAAKNGFKQFGSTNMACGIVRGNIFGTGYSGANSAYMAIGNLKSGLSTNGNASFFTSAVNSPAPTCVNWVVAYNKVLGHAATSGTLCSINNEATATNSHGGALVQNVFERTDPSTATGGIGIASDETTGTPVNNIIVWHNTVAGVKMNGPYNSNGTAAAYRLYWSFRNNVFYDHNQKDDRFIGGTAGNGGVGARVGDFASGVYSVNRSGDLLGDDSNGFGPAFLGIKSIFNNWSASSPSVYFKFINHRALNGQAGVASAAPGGGDYRLQLTSPAVLLPRELVVPFDVLGNRRFISAAGAYAFAQSRANSTGVTAAKSTGVTAVNP